jgi:hypothetical protein
MVLTGEMSMDQWWNGADRGNEYGAMVEWCWQGKLVWSNGGMVLTWEMSTEQWWNGADRGNEYGAMVEWC